MNCRHNKEKELISNLFICNLCDYSCKRKNDYLKHCSTQKHIDMEFYDKYKHNPEKLKKYQDKKETHKFICKCGNKYKYNSGLCRHKQKCKLIQCEYTDNNETKHNNINLDISSEKIIDLVSLVKDLIQENKSIQDKLVEVSQRQKPMIIQQNNNHFSIKAYLNNECKNAMNLSDYVQQIKVTFDDLLYMKEHGIVKVFENTFVKGLREMDETERPIHCSDRKRGNFYVKDQDMWMKDPENEKIITALKMITDQQCSVLKEWRNLNSDWLDNECKQEQTNIITRKIVDIYGEKNQHKILNLLTHLEINKKTD